MTDQPDPLDGIDYAVISKQHPEKAKWGAVLDNYRLLYKGGEDFLLAAGQQWQTRAQNSQATTGGIALIDGMATSKRRRRFLYQLEGEPDVKYFGRWERAYYIGYYGSIIDYFTGWLFTQKPEIRPIEGDAPKWWSEFYRNCNGRTVNLLDFVRDSFRDSLIVRRAGWLIGTADMATATMTEAEAEAAGMAGAYLSPFAIDDIVDWDVDAGGDLNWIILRKCTTQREFPREREQVETFMYVDRDRWRAWRTYQNPQGREGTKELQDVGQGEHGLGKVPFAWFEIPHGLWVGNKLAGWQTSMFNQGCMLDYSRLVSCFPQPTITTHEGDQAQSRIFGEGLILNLRAGRTDMDAETFQWVVPDVAPLEFSSKAMADQLQEGFRIVHQMGAAVDAKSASIIGRSGVSKIEDRKATEVILAAFGGYVRDAIIRTATLISEIMGDNTIWTCDGFDNFEVSGLDEELATAALVSSMGIPSATFKKRLMTSIATGRILGHLDEATAEVIAKEIEDSVDLDTESGMQGFGGFPGKTPPPIDPNEPPTTTTEPPEAA